MGTVGQSLGRAQQGFSRTFTWKVDWKSNLEFLLDVCSLG